jgi:hypothetical protein
VQPRQIFCEKEKLLTQLVIFSWCFFHAQILFHRGCVHVCDTFLVMLKVLTKGFKRFATFLGLCGRGGLHASFQNGTARQPEIKIAHAEAEA